MIRASRLAYLAYVSLLSAALAVSGERPVHSGELMDKVKSGEPIRIGYSETDPYSFSKPDGTFTGSDVEVLKYVLRELGARNTEAVRAAFGGLIPGLKANRLDIIASGMFVKPDRCKQVAFSEPIFELGAALVVKKGNPKNIHSLADIARDPSVILGIVVGAGGYADQAAKAGVKPEQIVSLPDTPALFAAIKAGRMDAEMETTLTVLSNMKAANDPNLERATPFEQLVVDGKPVVAVGAYAFRQSDGDFLNEFNKHLVALRDSPKYLEIIGPFGFSEENIPRNLTTAQVCAG